MTGTLPLDLGPQPKMLRDHKVLTLPSLQSALADLVREATDRGHRGPINLADFDPKQGVIVALNDDGAGNLFISFRRNRT